MNQEQNNLNPNNFNIQGNNGMPNNQPLNNQSFNQQPINPQSQPTPSFQQSIMQEPTSQPINNSYERGNASNQSFNSKPPKKMNLGLVIGIVATIVIAVVGIVLGSKFLNGENNNDLDNSIIDNNDKDNSSSTKYESNEDLPGTIEINLSSIKYCIDGPNKQLFNKGFVYSNGHYDSNLGHVESYFVIYDQYEKETSELLYDIQISEIKKPSDVIVGMKNQVIRALKYPHILAENYDYKITNQKDVKINGYNMSRFEGTLYFLYDIENPDVDYKEANFVGYSLIKDGNPIYFIVGERPNKSNPINIGELADKIVKTFRDYDGNCYDD